MAIFQPTLPVWGETEDNQSKGVRRYFNPLSPCGERRTRLRACGIVEGFQPTLPVWGETSPFPASEIVPSISTHSPRVGRDIDGMTSFLTHRLFQPTLPVWGET